MYNDAVAPRDKVSVAGPSRRGLKKPRIQALARADAILEAIATSPSGRAGLTYVARATGLNKTTAFNLVQSLVALGYVAFETDTRTYRLGLRNLQLGRRVQRQNDIVKAARPFLMELCKSLGETVNLALPYLFDAMIVESFEGSFGVRATSYAGTRAAYHATACGKAILAYLDTPTRSNLYSTHPLSAVTPNTITDPDRLEAQLAEVRARGYALDIEENELSANCVGVPIFDALREVVGSISIAGPASRMTRESLPALAESAQQQARYISERLLGSSAVQLKSPRRRLYAHV